MFIFLISLMFLIFIAYIFYYIEMYTISTTKYTFEDSRVKNNFKIIHLSDFHSIKFPDDNKELLDKIKKENPDAIIVTGDIVMYGYDCENAFALMKELKKICKVYFIRGNHDIKESNSYDMLKKLEAYGIIVTESKSIELKKYGIVIHGLMDFIDEEWDDKDYIKNEKIKNLNKLNIENNRFNLLMTHRPYDLELFKDYGFDLVLCGHTHGGQWIIPGLGGLISPDRKIFFPEYDYGLKKLGNTHLIINRGLGGVKWAIRLFNRPEIGIIEIKRKQN